MSQKRSSTEKPENIRKKHKPYFSQIPSTQLLESTYCTTGDEDDSGQQEIYDVNGDLAPHIYFNLASVLVRPSQIKHNKYKDPNVMELFRHAYRLGVHTISIKVAINKIVLLTGEFTVKKVEKLLQATNLDKDRELTFIESVMDKLQAEPFSDLNDLIKKHNGSTINNLTKILFNDIRFARLLPLVSILYDIHKSTPPTAQTSRIEVTPQIEVESIVSIDGSGDLFDLNNSSSSSILDFTNDVTGDEPQDRQSTYIVSEEVVHSSQEVISSQDFSIRYSSQTQGVSSSQEVSAQQSLVLDVASSQPPNYDELSTQEIQAKVKSNGYKPGTRTQMIKCLEECRLARLTKTSQRNSPLSERPTDSSPPHSPATTLISEDTPGSQLVQGIKSNQDIWTKIITYQEVDLDNCSKLFSCKKSELRKFLDLYGSNNSQSSNKRSRQ